MFIDDEADVSNCGDPAAAAAAAESSDTSSSHNDDEFDSSFIDDDQDKSEPSTSMTKQYLQSVRYICILYSFCFGQNIVTSAFRNLYLTSWHSNLKLFSRDTFYTD